MNEIGTTEEVGAVDGLRAALDLSGGEGEWMQCIYCRRRRPVCGFYPIAFMSMPAGSGQLCHDCDAWLRAGSPPRVTPSAEEPAP